MKKKSWPVHEGGYDCPACGKANEAAFPVDPRDAREPNVDDPLICFSCGSIGLYTAQGCLRSPTMVEVAGLMKWPELVRALKSWHETMGERREQGGH